MLQEKLGMLELLKNNIKKGERLMSKEPDPRWTAAQERVAFRYRLYRFLIMNGALWLLWLLTYLWTRCQFTPIIGTIHAKKFAFGAFPWPLYITIIWGVFILLDYLKTQAVEQEYTKIKQKDKEDDLF